ncbi:hypothetical protein NLI96_g12098 [Meripilus lineatus]|uniref:Uncharacterized protein n=1 Tax=Meripilus lineatus TaxID=2056292 RepID=A0AAD5URY7_9APHY|nr:hypothetical protein NLI96_g12098 [Physisporinus lineatus]
MNQQAKSKAPRQDQNRPKTKASAQDESRTKSKPAEGNTSACVSRSGRTRYPSALAKNNPSYGNALIKRHRGVQGEESSLVQSLVDRGAEMDVPVPAKLAGRKRAGPTTTKSNKRRRV